MSVIFVNNYIFRRKLKHIYTGFKLNDFTVVCFDVSVNRLIKSFVILYGVILKVYCSYFAGFIVANIKNVVINRYCNRMKKCC